MYITGSNAYFMSGELATLLTGRHVELSMTPLSFQEFCDGFSKKEQKAKEYMSGIYHTILLNDIVKRLKIADVNMLEEVTRFLMHNIGNRTSSAAIANTMVSNRKKIDQKTVDRYIRGLTDSLLFYEVRRYNIKGRQFLATMNKYYVCDIGMRNMLVRGQDSDIGHILENLVYLELRRRYADVYVGQLDRAGKVDFVVLEERNLAYFQVAATTLDEKVLERELAPLRKIKDNYPKYLLTLDEAFGELNYDGIQKINILKWMQK